MNKRIERTKLFLFVIIFAILFLVIILSVKADAIPTYVHEINHNKEVIKYNSIQQWDIFKNIRENENLDKKEEIIQEDEDIEYTTIYKKNKELPKGIIQVIQEGRDGKQQKITKRVYDGDKLVDEKMKINIIIADVDKIVEIGDGNFLSNYKVKIGDLLYVTSNTLAIRTAPNKNSEKVITIKKNDSVKLIEIKDSWYKIKYKTYEGYIDSNCVTYIDPNTDISKYSEEKLKSEILKTLNYNMDLNKPSGLSIEQFKKVLSNNSQDKNKVFENNYEYFYYIEKQYNINGVFVAAVGIHESNWGTSKISLNKLNLFGYGAIDTNPYENARTFKSYSEGIDLIARVFVKYYINDSGTNIYDGEVANGKYYNGANLKGVNIRYASDNNWSNGVYKWMSYLYNRL